MIYLFLLCAIVIVVRLAEGKSVLTQFYVFLGSAIVLFGIGVLP